MNLVPAWLPDLVRFVDYDGDWTRYIEAVYGHFTKDFIVSRPSWPQRRWALKRHPMHRAKEATFWHIVQEGKIEDDRTPDFRRCERIRWPRPIIDAARQDRVRLWQNKRGRESRIVLAVNDFSYVVVLADRGDYVMLWTAYPVERKHQREKLRKECENYEKQQKG